VNPSPDREVQVLADSITRFFHGQLDCENLRSDVGAS
jgi:hypothetical protein